MGVSRLVAATRLVRGLLSGSRALAPVDAAGLPVADLPDVLAAPVGVPGDACRPLPFGERLLDGGDKPGVGALKVGAGALDFKVGGVGLVCILHRTMMTHTYAANKVDSQCESE